MSDVQAGTRVFLTASGSEHHPPVGTNGTVVGVRQIETDDLAVTVRWDDGSQSVVTRWNAVLAVAP